MAKFAVLVCLMVVLVAVLARGRHGSAREGSRGRPHHLRYNGIGSGRHDAAVTLGAFSGDARPHHRSLGRRPGHHRRGRHHLGLSRRQRLGATGYGSHGAGARGTNRMEQGSRTKPEEPNFRRIPHQEMMQRLRDELRRHHQGSRRSPGFRPAGQGRGQGHGQVQGHRLSLRQYGGGFSRHHLGNGRGRMRGRHHERGIGRGIGLGPW
ncbi:uncharacterized protein LOC143302234 [Babylonia areolata]|uniref:uncharacterized protein LOC143302234 n=1 Tax=Babylonia areolata TaxID=304850 RepID=UPI003FD60009